MNSLEFIEKIIKNIETALAEDKRVYQLYLSKNNIDKNKILKNLDENIKHREESLQTFQQIKTELEAWEIVKKDFILTWEEPNNASGYYLKYFGDCKYEKIKKALEVENEK